MRRPNKKVEKKWNHLFDIDTDRGLVILGLYVPGELRQTPAYGRLWFPSMIFASLSNEETPKEALNLLVIVRPKAKLKQPVKWVSSKVDKGATRGQHDGFSWGPSWLQNFDGGSKTTLPKKIPATSDLCFRAESRQCACFVLTGWEQTNQKQGSSSTSVC